jgi:selenide, water dikinase
MVRMVHLLGRQRGEVAAPLVGLEQDLVGDHVELLLRLALHVLRARRAQHAGERALADGDADRLAGARDDLDQQAQVGLGADPPRGTRVILMSPERHTSYSGMLPGLVAGHYDFDDCHIDLAPLCRAARVEFRLARACGLEPDACRVLCADGSVLGYDVLSINVGATPDAASIPGALEHATSVKPVARFTAAWDRIRSSAASDSRPPRVAVVGSGAGGVEIALAMHYRLRIDRGTSAAPPEFSIFSDTATLLPGYPDRAQRIFENLFRERGITTHLGRRVMHIESGLVQRSGAPPIVADHIVLATGAGAPAWLAGSGLETDARGFIAVNDALQSLSHPNVFAAGDVATMAHHARPKSGVYAVRQGPPLAANLRRMLAGQVLVRYTPQKSALALISTGDRNAVACMASLVFAGRWVWRWKNWIDRRFMARYRTS